MRCVKCGREVSPNMRFCPYCETPVRRYNSGGQQMNMRPVNRTNNMNSFNRESNAGQYQNRERKVNMNYGQLYDNRNRGQFGRRIKCPSCGGINLHYVTDNETMVRTTGKNYSGAKGCLGYLLLGPFGLLCGSCGSSQKTTVTNNNRHFWVCYDCGYKFKTQEDIEEEIRLAQRGIKCAYFSGITLMPMIIMCLILRIFFCAVILGLTEILMIICAVVIKQSLEKKEEEYEEFERNCKM